MGQPTFETSQEEQNMEIAQYRQKETNHHESEMDSRIQQVLHTYQNRYPGLFHISMKEAKDDVRFIFDASKK